MCAARADGETPSGAEARPATARLPASSISPHLAGLGCPSKLLRPLSAMRWDGTGSDGMEARATSVTSCRRRASAPYRQPS
eukprot:scaffold5501_cov242-Prasinococcus_capsulatus_cf.AAC.1